MINMIRALAVALIACGIGLLVSSLIRGYTTWTNNESIPCIMGKSFKLLDGVWAPRNIYLNVVVERGEADIKLYSNGKFLREWNNTNGFIERLQITERGHSYLLIKMIKADRNCTVSAKISFYGMERDLLSHAVFILIIGIILYILSMVKERRVALIAILIFFVLSIRPVYSVPVWMKPGTYAVYTANSFMSIMFVNGTIIQGDWKSYLMWKCINISGSQATLLVNFTLVNSSGKIVLSVMDYVRVNLNNRKVYYKGKEIGMTAMFLWPIPHKYEEVNLTRVYEKNIKGKVEKTNVMFIPGYGHQKAVSVRYNYTVVGFFNNHNYTLQGEGVSVLYDTDTGILLCGELDLEPLFIVAGVNTMTGNHVTLKKTNVDIGPSDMATEIYFLAMKILFVAIVIAPIVIAIYILRRKRSH